MRFYLHLRGPDGLLIEDENGAEYTSVNAAKQQAIKRMRELATTSINAGALPPVLGVVIHDWRGWTQQIIDLAEVLST